MPCPIACSAADPRLQQSFAPEIAPCPSGLSMPAIYSVTQLCHKWVNVRPSAAQGAAPGGNPRFSLRDGNAFNQDIAGHNACNRMQAS
jgi:hypothetical protein